MGQLDFERLHNISQMMDEYGIRVDSGDNTALRPYFAATKRLYKNIRVLVLDIKRMDKEIKEIERLVVQMENKRTTRQMRAHITKKVRQRMDDFTDNLHDIKQMAGLGFSTHKKMSSTAKWRGALRG